MKSEAKTYFFFAFDTKFNIIAKCIGLYHHLQSLHMHVYLAFVIATAAGKYFTIDDHGIKRAAFPKLQWFNRLHIVMAIYQYSWF